MLHRGCCHSPVYFRASAACAVCPARCVGPTECVQLHALCILRDTAMRHVHGCQTTAYVYMHQHGFRCAMSLAAKSVQKCKRASRMVPDDSGSQVPEDNLDGLQPQQAGLSRLSLNILDHYQEFVDAAPPCANFKVLLDRMHAEQKATVCRLHSTHGSKIPEALMSPSCLQGLAHLTNLTRLTIRTSDVIGCQPLSVIAGLTSLRCMRLPSPPDPLPLSSLRCNAHNRFAITHSSILLKRACASSASASRELLSRRHLTALVLGADGDDERFRYNSEVAESSEDDEHIAALVQALPQLRALKLFDYGTDLVTNAGEQGAKAY